MALPHLPTTYTTRKNIYEAAMVNRRTKENDFREKWGKNADYFNRENVTANVKKTWESNTYFKCSMDAFQSNFEKETKALNLKRRRLKLAQMLREEREEFEAELKGLSTENYARIEEMRDRSEALKSAREEKRQAVAQEKLYEHWRVNSPDIRQLEQIQHQQHVIEEWGEQIAEHEIVAEKERKMKEAYEKELEEKRLLALELERERDREKLEEEKRLKDVLKKQMRELKDKEMEAKELKRKEAELHRERLALAELEEQRKQIEEQRQKVEFGRVLLRQHAAALRRRSKQIQEELEQDRKFLEILAEREEHDRDALTTRREKAVADAFWMKQVIEDQIRLEKAREAELDMLYQDEAARVWEQRESEWAKERAARERLMKEVLDDRRDQISAKMEENRRKQEESLERREELLRDLELANQLTRREEELREAEKTTRKQELEAQMTSRQRADQVERLHLKLELEEDKKAEDDYEKMLQEEAKRLNIRGYQPKNYARKQAWT